VYWYRYSVKGETGRKVGAVSDDGYAAIKITNEARRLLVESFGIPEGYDYEIVVRPHSTTLLWSRYVPVQQESVSDDPEDAKRRHL
jgi:hypothetical protein